MTYTQTNLAQLLDCAVATVQRAKTRNIITGQLKGKRTLYSDADADALRKWLAEPENHRQKPWQESVKEQGYYSIVSASEAVGVPTITFNSWLKSGILPRPSHWLRTRYWYDEADIATLKRLIDEHYHRPSGKLNLAEMAATLGVARATLKQWVWNNFPELGEYHGSMKWFTPDEAWTILDVYKGIAPTKAQIERKTLDELLARREDNWTTNEGEAL